MKDMIKETFKSAVEPRYEAPAVVVLDMKNEGVLCASTQDFDDEIPADELLDW